MMLIVSAAPRDNPERRPALAEHRADVRCKVVRPLVCGEVPTCSVLRLECNVPNRACPPAHQARCERVPATGIRDAYVRGGGFSSCGKNEIPHGMELQRSVERWKAFITS